MPIATDLKQHILQLHYCYLLLKVHLQIFKINSLKKLMTKKSKMELDREKRRKTQNDTAFLCIHLHEPSQT